MPALTNLSYLRELSEKYGISPSKKMGQNFLINPHVCPKICEAAGINSRASVLEIGPGFGTLTRELAARAKKVVALELDARLIPVLGETLAGFTNSTVLNEDVMKTDLPSLLEREFEGPVLVCANLPYYITSPILMKLLESRLPLDSITVMVQKEAAERLTARPGTRQAGAISYAIQYYSEPRLCFTVKPGSFYPAPKVASAVIHLRLRDKLPLAGKPRREQRLFRLIQAAFSQRRKTLANAVSANLLAQKEVLIQALQELGLNLLIRPEQLTLEEYIHLEEALWPMEEME